MLLSTAEEVLGRQRKKIQPWVTNEVLDLYDQRRQLKQQQYSSTEAVLEYRKVNREVRTKMKAAREEWTEKQCKKMEKGMMSGNSKEAYNTLKAFTKTQRRRQQWKHPDGEIWKTKEWPKEWTQSLIIFLLKKGNFKQCQGYRTMSLISHSRKIKLRVTLNRLKAKAEELLPEEQTGFRPFRSTIEYIFNG